MPQARARAHRRPRRRPRAFTLLETLISGSILIVGLSGLYSAYGQVRQTYAFQRDIAVAGTIGERIMELAITLYPQSPYLEPGTHPGVGTPLYFDKHGNLSNQASSYFELYWHVTAAEPIASTKEVKVEVCWPTCAAADHRIWLRTYRE